MAIGRDEEENKEWNRFWGSGRVDDYLSFKASCRTACLDEGAGEHAGVDRGDGNRAESHPRGGV